MSPPAPEASPGPESRLSRLFSLRRSVGPGAAPVLDQVNIHTVKDGAKSIQDLAPIEYQSIDHRGVCSEELNLKGKLGDFFYLFKVFIGPKLRQVSIGNFHRKAPKLVKNQAKGSKIHKIRTLLLILSSDLLWESINSVLRATVGIHLYTRVDSHSSSEDRIGGFPQ